ncbi:urease accessory protein UreE [Chitinophaga agrisoli]|uniref:Urease accessory protein UreE n=1 Tax=Chitinophaga agrisoli TaxID=2607653 RepID=A0A5B2VHI4_9BACT|nr:urease accessory protein UreE [Chitinophaga agrisoli]KAA2238591.1 urease accessory protein UreE [Chitinophaga agrisoli]
MIIEDIIGNINTVPAGSRQTDLLQLEWYETARRIQRKQTVAGRDVALRLLKQGQRLQQGDIVYMDDQTMVVTDILPCEAIVVKPASMEEMGAVCYEIGNKHLPVFLQDNEVLIPWEEPLFRWLEAAGYAPVKAVRKLTNMLRSNVMPHSHGDSGGTSLFQKIINLTR